MASRQSAKLTSPCCMSKKAASKPAMTTVSATRGIPDGIQPANIFSPAASRARSVNPGMGPLLAGLDLGHRLRHELVHGASDLMLGLVDVRSLEIGQYLAQHVVIAGLLEVGHHHRLGVGVRIGTMLAELLGRPEAQHAVAARGGPKPQLLVMRELPLEAFLALVERGHGWIPVVPQPVGVAYSRAIPKSTERSHRTTSVHRESFARSTGGGRSASL